MMIAPLMRPVTWECTPELRFIVVGARYLLQQKWKGNDGEGYFAEWRLVPTVTEGNQGEWNAPTEAAT